MLAAIMEQVNKVAGSTQVKLLIELFQIWAASKGNTPVQCPGLLPQGIQIMFNRDNPLVLAVIALVRCYLFVFEVSFNGIAKYFNIYKATDQFFRYRITVGAVTDRGIFINPELL